MHFLENAWWTSFQKTFVKCLRSICLKCWDLRCFVYFRYRRQLSNEPFIEKSVSIQTRTRRLKFGCGVTRAYRPTDLWAALGDPSNCRRASTSWLFKRGNGANSVFTQLQEPVCTAAVFAAALQFSCTSFIPRDLEVLEVEELFCSFSLVGDGRKLSPLAVPSRMLISKLMRSASRKNVL